MATYKKKSNESWLLTVTTTTNLTGRVNNARLIIKKSVNDSDANAKFSEEVAVTDPAAFSVLFTVPASTTHGLSGLYFYEIWTYKTDKSDAILIDSGTVEFSDPLLDTL